MYQHMLARLQQNGLTYLFQIFSCRWFWAADECHYFLNGIGSWTLICRWAVADSNQAPVGYWASIVFQYAVLNRNTAFVIEFTATEKTVLSCVWLLPSKFACNLPVFSAVY